MSDVAGGCVRPYACCHELSMGRPCAFAGPADGDALVPGARFRSLKLRDYTLILKGRARQPGAWYVEEAGSSSHGVAVAEERYLLDPKLFFRLP